jgi:hypothetical protein
LNGTARSKTVVLRYRIHLESRNLALGTINLRLGAVRRLVYEASDCGLLSSDLAAGKVFRRVIKNGTAWVDTLTEKAVWHVSTCGHVVGILIAVSIEQGIHFPNPPGVAAPGGVIFEAAP